MLRIIICEDNLAHLNLNRELIENAIKLFGEKYEIRTFVLPEVITVGDIEWANIAFLDINLGINKQSGIQLAEQALSLNKWLAIVFITAYQEYTGEAFKLQAFGYLEKPIIKRELVGIIERLIRYLKTDNESQFLEIVDRRITILLKMEDIIYIEKFGRKVTLFTMEKDIEVNQSIVTLEDKLNSSFIKINQGVIINKRYVNRLEGDMIYLMTGEKLKVSRRRIKSVSGQLSI